MAYIAYSDESGDSNPLLAELYEQNRDPKHGVVDNILRIHASNPESLRGHIDIYKTLMYGRSELTRAQREMIAVVVSRCNNCHY